MEAALQINQEVVALTPPEHPQYAVRLQSLAVSFRDRYRRLGDLKDLEAALKTDQEAVVLTPPEHPQRAERLQSLAVSFGVRYPRLGHQKDMEAALQTNQEAVALVPPEHPQRAERLQTLALSFIDRYRRLGDLKNLAAIHTHYNESFKLPTSDPETSWKQALSWTYFAEEFQSSYCVPAFQEAFDLLPEILWIGHSIPLCHDAIRRLNVSDATSTAVQTCIGLSRYREALELLEQGVATIFQ
jgi:tetratricopeptide (TPR) repeat protein